MKTAALRVTETGGRNIVLMRPVNNIIEFNANHRARHAALRTFGAAGAKTSRSPGFGMRCFSCERAARSSRPARRAGRKRAHRLAAAAFQPAVSHPQTAPRRWRSSSGYYCAISLLACLSSSVGLNGLFKNRETPVVSASARISL